MKMLLVFSLIFVALNVATGGALAQSDPFAKWKPNVGDRFAYHYEYRASSGGNHAPDSSKQIDTVIEQIMKVDSMLDSIHPFVVVVKTWHVSSSLGFDTSQELFDFQVGSVPSSLHSFAISNPLARTTGEPHDMSIVAYDFSNSRDSEITIDSRTLAEYSFNLAVLFYWGLGGNPWLKGKSGAYSPELHWFVSRAGYDDYPGEGNTNNSWSSTSWSSTLLYGHTLAVRNLPLHSTSNIDVESDGPFLYLIASLTNTGPYSFTLFDPIGRPLRSWQMPAEAGERQITLNVADVPSGVYFLRVSGGGVEGVRKVCIAH